MLQKSACSVLRVRLPTSLTVRRAGVSLSSTFSSGRGWVSTSHADNAATRFAGVPVPRSFSSKSKVAKTADPEDPPPPSKEAPSISVFDNSTPIDFTDISRAHVNIRGGVVYTQCKLSPFLSKLCDMNVYLKCEFNQYTGSFKERGARNTLLTLLQLETEGNTSFDRKKGVIAASAGNHALALAYHGGLLGVTATVVMPEVAPLAKVDKCRMLGANVIIEGAHIGESKEYAEGLAEEKGLIYVNGYDDRTIVSGAGTVGMEIIEQCPNVDAVVVPVGGAGLIAGIACAIKTLKPKCKVYGVEPEFAASYTEALRAGKPVFTEVTPTLADGLAVPVVGSNAFEVARKYVDKTFLTDEQSVAVACLRLIENEKMVVEGGGCAGLTAVLPGGPLHKGEYYCASIRIRIRIRVRILS